MGAETKRERGASSALPPLYFLHVWWARRPLTPSRAAILASLLPADTDPDWFLRQLGIERVEALVGGIPWVVPDEFHGEIEDEQFALTVRAANALAKEQRERATQRQLIQELLDKEPALSQSPAILTWQTLALPFLEPLPGEGVVLQIQRRAADPNWFNELMSISSQHEVRVPNLYGYARAYNKQPAQLEQTYTVLDPTAGGGSIPFEALRLGCNVIANDLNPVASVILQATLDYPRRYPQLNEDLEYWGNQLLGALDNSMDDFFPRRFRLPDSERQLLTRYLVRAPELLDEYNWEDTTSFLFVRQVTCPNCLGEAPLLNSSWLSKSGDKWGVKVITDGRERNGKVWFDTYRIKGTRGPNGEDPNLATVVRGVGTCVHCGQQIAADEIKEQARGESPLGRWQDRLYTVVAIRYQPKLDKQGRVQYYKSGARAGEVRTEKIRFFRPANATDLAALQAAERRLAEKWDEWESVGLIPTELLQPGYNTAQPLSFGVKRWCDMFTPRQLLGHITLTEELMRLKPQIIEELGEERGKAVITYLQFAIDKGVDYNCRQTRWHYGRGVIVGTFGRHDFGPKWTFGEIVFSGPDSGAKWAQTQVIDAYTGIAGLAASEVSNSKIGSLLHLLNGTAAALDVEPKSVDLVCMDPPYYNNVQYAELSDFYYVWQKRTLSDLYPGLFRARQVNKIDEAVANPKRAGSVKKADAEYKRLMSEIFAECHRVLKDDGLLTLMFTHKTQEAWEALTHSLITSGWIITSSFPVESESTESLQLKNKASAVSSVFLSCRKRVRQSEEPSSWVAFGGQGVATQIRQAVEQGLEEFAQLNLNPVDEMVACYGRALHILSENWPVMDGDELVSPLRAMNEASLVVAEHHLQKLTQGRVQVADLNPEAAMALTILGIYGFNELPYDDALNLSRSLRITLDAKTGGYQIGERMIGYNQRVSKGRGLRGEGYFAPLIRQRSKLQLATPAERAKARLDNPQTEWDVLQGLIAAYHEGDIPVARAYLGQHAAGRENLYLDLLHVWALHEENEMERKRINNLIFGLKL